jgi:hypothetical protein
MNMEQMQYWFLTPARVIMVICGNLYEYRNNELEARSNLYDYIRMR